MAASTIGVAASCCVSGIWDQRRVVEISSARSSSQRRNVEMFSRLPLCVRNVPREDLRKDRNGKPKLEFATRNRQQWRICGVTAVAVAADEKEDVQQAKFQLLSSLIETGRGLGATAEQRAIIEEALVAVEKFDAGMPLELDALDGTWLLQFTTAPDVVQILQASETPLLKVGQIFQKFECKGRTDGGVVRNVVRWSIPRILQDDDGATLVVTAKFSVVSPRSIALSFEEAELGQIAISDEFQGFLAPAVLPRTFLTFQILQFFRTLSLRVPLLRPGTQTERSKSVPAGLWYYLTYLDNDMLCGRAIGSGGVFIFRRTQQLQLSQTYKYNL